MDRKHVVAGMAVVACVFGSSAHADEDSGPYLGASIGWAMDEARVFDTGDTFEDSGIAFKVFGGYSFNRYFAAELAYVEADKLEDRVARIDVTSESSGLIAAFLGKLPLSDSFSLFAKAGWALYEERASFRLGSLSASEKNDADDPVYGVGAELAIGERVKLRAEYEMVDIPRADFDIVSVGATLRF
jgi:OOP family OmpA-OmpF porin